MILVEQEKLFLGAKKCNKTLVNVPSGLGRFQRPTILALGNQYVQVIIFGTSDIIFIYYSFS